MKHWQCRWALPWAMCLLLLGSQLLGTHSWSSQEEKDSDMEIHFPAAVEYVLHIFHLQSKDLKAYTLAHILNFWKKQVEDNLAFSMVLALLRTECGKFDEDTDNCPFQESPELNNTEGWVKEGLILVRKSDGPGMDSLPSQTSRAISQWHNLEAQVLLFLGSEVQ
ncbi:cystatin-9-like [Meles meles]|uniref:cystatin-9-like n=1 Tax=Meles meles TaxID=9662 RepID=UPI001E698870|nr:cystatin-9-like [Meles meles]